MTSALAPMFRLIEQADDGVIACKADPEHPPCGAVEGPYVLLLRKTLTLGFCLAAEEADAPLLIRNACQRMVFSHYYPGAPEVPAPEIMGTGNHK
jgi:hypothetical protein